MWDAPYFRPAILIGAAALFILCDVLAANWAKNNSSLSLWALVLLAPLAYFSFGVLNQRYALSIASAWIVLVVCVSSVILGITVFDDKLTLRQGIGVVLAVVSAALMLR